MSFLLSEDKHNNRLDSGRLQWLLGVIDVLKGDAIELSFVDVRHTVVFPSLARGDGRFKIILDAYIGYAATKRKTINPLNNAPSKPMRDLQFGYLNFVSVRIAPVFVPRTAIG